MSVYTIVNDKVKDFIRDNGDSNVVIQLKKANECRDRQAFAQLLNAIKELLTIEREIERNKARIQSHIASIQDIKSVIKEQENLIKNGKNYHKIKRQK